MSIVAGFIIFLWNFSFSMPTKACAEVIFKYVLFCWSWGGKSENLVYISKKTSFFNIFLMSTNSENIKPIPETFL